MAGKLFTCHYYEKVYLYKLKRYKLFIYIISIDRKNGFLMLNKWKKSKKNMNKIWTGLLWNKYAENLISYSLAGRYL